MTATAGDLPRCPVCDASCVVLGAVDFNKSCEEARGTRLAPSGQLVQYVVCESCGFAFAPEFAAWTQKDFERQIYNDEYILVDPDYVEVRPRANSETLVVTFGDRGRSLRHLDYGGGAGRLSALLRQARWNSLSYDPFFDRATKLQRHGKFQLITCFEVFEHVPDVGPLVQRLGSLLGRDGLVLVSTVVSDGELAPGRPITWWYASPRNGHISLFSTKSLGVLAQRHGFSFASFSPGMHALWRQQVPDWAQHLFQGGGSYRQVPLSQ